VSETRVALVTGAGGGIGAATARALAAEGFRVALHYRSSESQARALSQELPGALLLQADLSQPAEAEALVRALRESAGRLDVLVNNAGHNVNGLMPAMSLESYDAVAGLARGAWLLTKLVLRRFMLRQRSGRIINVSSVVGHTGNPGQVPYTMAKAGLDAMTRSLAQALAGRGLLVSVRAVRGEGGCRGRGRRGIIHSRVGGADGAARGPVPGRDGALSVHNGDPRPGGP